MLTRWFWWLILAGFGELVLLLRLADALGWTTMFAWIVITGLAGAWLFRRGGLRTFSRLNEELQSQTSRTVSVVASALLVLAGLLLLLPGVLADFLGLVLLIPAVRQRMARRMISHFTGQFVIPETGRGDSFVDVEVVARGESETSGGAVPRIE